MRDGAGVLPAAGPTPASWHLPGARREAAAGFSPAGRLLLSGPSRRELRAAAGPLVWAAGGGEERSGTGTVSCLGEKLLWISPGGVALLDTRCGSNHGRCTSRGIRFIFISLSFYCFGLESASCFR